MINLINADKMSFILDQTDIEHYKEVILANDNEHKAIHKDLEDKISDLSDAIKIEMPIYEKYGIF